MAFALGLASRKPRSRASLPPLTPAVSRHVRLVPENFVPLVAQMLDQGNGIRVAKF